MKRGKINNMIEGEKFMESPYLAMEAGRE